MALYRTVKCNFWSDDYILELESPGKTIFLWFFTNEHTNLSGIYNVSKKTVAYETGFSIEEVSNYFERFIQDKKVVYTEGKLLWVKNYLRHQPQIRSQQCLKKVADELREIKDKDLIAQYLEYYNDFKIPLEYEKPKAKKTKKPRFELTDKEEEIIKELEKVSNYPIPPLETVKYLRDLCEEFPGVDPLETIKEKRAWWDGKPLQKNSNPHLQIRNWFIISAGESKAQKKEMSVGKSMSKKDEFVSPTLLHEVYKIVKKNGEDITKFGADALKHFDKMRDEWEKSDKKPETFIRILNKYRDPF